MQLDWLTVIHDLGLSHPLKFHLGRANPTAGNHERPSLGAHSQSVLIVDEPWFRDSG